MGGGSSQRTGAGRRWAAPYAAIEGGATLVVAKRPDLVQKEPRASEHEARARAPEPRARAERARARGIAARRARGVKNRRAGDDAASTRLQRRTSARHANVRT